MKKIIVVYVLFLSALLSLNIASAYNPAFNLTARNFIYSDSIGAGGGDLQIGGVRQAVVTAGEQQHGSGIDLGAFEDAVEGQMGYRGDIRQPSQFKRQAAERGGGLTHPLEWEISGGAEEPGLPPPMGDGGGRFILQDVRFADIARFGDDGGSDDRFFPADG